MINFTPLLKAYARLRYAKIATMDPVKTQTEQLLGLVRYAANTRFGREHNFSKIKTLDDYQKQIPLRSYEDFWNTYWKDSYPILENITWPGRIPYFPVTSGTTSGTTKYIPYSKALQNSNVKAGLDLLVYHVINHPNSRLFDGKSFVLGGSTDLVEEAPGIYSGDLSGIVTKTRPFWVAPFYFPSTEMALIKDWEEKIDIMSRASLKEKIRLLSGVPAWLLILSKKLFELKPEAEGNLSRVYPDLEMIVHGGVNFQPYLNQFKALIDENQTELREVYPSSEGFIAIADRGSGEGLRLNLDNGIFYEFVPLEELGSPNPTRHWIGNVQENVNYAIVLTTCGGAWSYVIGDTVKFIDTKVPRILVTGRTSYCLSAFGEHLIGEEIEDAVSLAASKIGFSVSDYSVGAIFPENQNELGGHRYIVEFAVGTPTPEQLQTFADVLDKRLIERNEDYAAHRAEGFGLHAPVITTVPSGTFAEWMKSRGKLGGQHKVPRIITKVELFEDLCRFAASKGQS